MKSSGDIFHTNTVEVLDGRLAGRLPAFREGNVLLTLREIDLVAVLDMDAARIVWALSSSWRFFSMRSVNIFCMNRPMAMVSTTSR